MILNVGETDVINYVTVPEGLNVSFKADNSGVVSVDNNGVVKALKGGTAYIMVIVGDNKKYTINSTTIYVDVFKLPSKIIIQNDTLDINVGDVVDPVISLVPSDAGNLSFTSSDSGVVLVDNKGIVTAVGEGNATIFVKFRGSDKYLSSQANMSVSVSKVVVEPEIIRNDTIVTVCVADDASGYVNLTVGNETLVAPIEDGVAILDLSDVPAGDYNATLAYSGDDKYAAFEVVYPISIEEDIIIIADDLVKYYHGAERFMVKITDGKNNPIVNASVTISINGIIYNRVTDDNGQSSMAINLDAGEYPVVVTCNDTTVKSTITVLSTVNGIDLVKVFRNDTQYYATFRDSEGNYLKDGTTVRFNIHGVFYDHKITGNKGLDKLNINLEPGEYIITAINLVTGESRANKITVLSRIVENYDLTKFYRNDSQYSVKIIGDDGKAVGAGENVTFNINGVFYTCTTNASGIAKLNINLEPGDYIITVEHRGCVVSNNIKVLPVLTAQDLIKKYGTNDQFVASLVDGQGKAYASQSIQFNIHGVFYNRVTDSNGQAKLNINLQPGEYIITSSYNGAYIANKVTVTA